MSPVKGAMSKATGDTTPSHVTDHPFRPPSRSEWWRTCVELVERNGEEERCALAEAAHKESMIRREAP